MSKAITDKTQIMKNLCMCFLNRRSYFLENTLPWILRIYSGEFKKENAERILKNHYLFSGKLKIEFSPIKNKFLIFHNGHISEEFPYPYEVTFMGGFKKRVREYVELEHGKFLNETTLIVNTTRKL